MKNKLKLIVVLFVALLMITGCTTTKSYNFKVETGDTIKISLNTNDGYDITSNLPFEISKDGEILSSGTFITLDNYNNYLSVVENDKNALIIEKKEKDGLNYLFYSYNNSEFNYIIKVKDSNTGLILGNPVSEDSAKECFARLTITKDK